MESDPQRAGELLLSIRLSECAEELVRYLSQQVNFVREPLNMERLAAACGDTPEALSALIANLPAEADATFLRELSACLLQSSENCKSKNKLRPREDLVEQMRHLWDRLQAQVKYCRDPNDITNEPALESDE